MRIDITSPAYLRDAARQLLDAFGSRRVFAFYGSMGAGKTTFIKAICRELGSLDNVTSPTFAIINEYTTSSDLLIYHFDFYRIKNLQEAYDLGYEDYFYSGHYCFIEWPEKIEELLPAEIVKVDIRAGIDEQRLVEVSMI
jgi:tRNA threonylcarbamoyladenosine biosynthesis protein TsaE